MFVQNELNLNENNEGLTFINTQWSGEDILEIMSMHF